MLQAIGTIEQPLDDVEIFHTDRGKEFDNQSIIVFYLFTKGSVKK